MHVLFLALGATRRRAVTDESAAVVADGGRAVVVIDRAKPWHGETFDGRVEILDLSRLEQRHPSQSIERVLLVTAPRRVFRAIRRGRLTRWSRRAERAFERRIAARVQRAVVPAYRRLWGDVRQRLIDSRVRRGRNVDLVVVCDPASMPYAARLIGTFGPGRRQARPRFAYGYDYAGVTGAANSRRLPADARGDDR